MPDSIDKCQDTPFLHEVDKQGCTTTILTLPFETENESLIMSLGYGYSTNEDLIDREVQHNTKLKVGYYLDNTYIGDDEVETVLPETAEGDDDDEDSDVYKGLQNKHNFYIGAGYFITDSLYFNLLYSDESSKFVSEHHIRTLSSSLYYKINKKWFTTLYYKREVLDEDLHDNLNLTLGYHIW